MNFDEEKLFDDEKWESDYPNFITIRVSDIMLRQLQIMKEDMYYSRSEVIREAINYYYRHYYLESLDNENFH